ncbi:hypothetical protein [Enterococcus rotai]|uniref:hypothetical protein n=1 Tax=Enterococcus rotai TaxID=118060 RepID=UPI0032B56254
MGIFDKKKKLKKIEQSLDIYKELRKKDQETIKRNQDTIKRNQKTIKILASDGMRNGSPEGAKELRKMQNREQ